MKGKNTFELNFATMAEIIEGHFNEYLPDNVTCTAIEANINHGCNTWLVTLQVEEPKRS